MRAYYQGQKPARSSAFEVGARSRKPPDGHLGIDIFARQSRRAMKPRPPDNSKLFETPRGTKVVAAFDGRVTRVGMLRNGMRVAVTHDNVRALWPSDGRPVGDCETLYLHLETAAVKVGDRVDSGDLIGMAGFNEHAAGALRHLHFGLWVKRFRAGGSRGLRGEVDPELVSGAWRWIDADGSVHGGSRVLDGLRDLVAAAKKGAGAASEASQALELADASGAASAVAIGAAKGAVKV